MNSEVEINWNITVLQQDIVQEYGLTIAAVLARMQMYCRKGNGVCTASLETIGKELSLNRATVGRHAQELCEEGYLQDMTPDLRNHPHTYRDTGKAYLVFSLSGQSGVAKYNTGVAKCNTEKSTKNSGVAINNTSQNGGVAFCNTNQPGVAINNTNGSGVAKSSMNHVVVVNTSLNIDKNQQQQAAFDRLLRARVSRKVADDLVSRFDPERILLACEVYEFERKAGRARGQGYLVKFLNENWSPPDEYTPAADICDECGKAKTNHEPGCRRIFSSSSILCPECHTYPCSCEDED